MGRKGSKGRTAERAGGVDVLQCARCYALLKELTLHLIPRARSGVFEMLPRRLASTRSQFELAERRKIERITHESIGIGNGANLLQATLRPADLFERLAINAALFPRGIDVVLVHDDSIVAIPRTTRLVAKGD